jgi:magnesium chelatase subunit H
MASWTHDGIAGLQSVVLYSLPELDGAIDTVVRSKLSNPRSVRRWSVVWQPGCGILTSAPLLAQPLGGLVDNNIFLVEERVQRLADRLKKWVALRRTPAKVHIRWKHAMP